MAADGLDGIRANPASASPNLAPSLPPSPPAPMASPPAGERPSVAPDSAVGAATAAAASNDRVRLRMSPRWSRRSESDGGYADDSLVEDVFNSPPRRQLSLDANSGAADGFYPGTLGSHEEFGRLASRDSSPLPPHPERDSQHTMLFGSALRSASPVSMPSWGDTPIGDVSGRGLTLSPLHFDDLAPAPSPEPSFTNQTIDMAPPSTLSFDWPADPRPNDPLHRFTSRSQLTGSSSRTSSSDSHRPLDDTPRGEPDDIEYHIGDSLHSSMPGAPASFDTRSRPRSPHTRYPPTLENGGIQSVLANHARSRVTSIGKSFRHVSHRVASALPSALPSTPTRGRLMVKKDHQLLSDDYEEVTPPHHFAPLAPEPEERLDVRGARLVTHTDEGGDAQEEDEYEEVIEELDDFTHSVDRDAVRADQREIAEPPPEQTDEKRPGRTSRLDVTLLRGNSLGFLGPRNPLRVAMVHLLSHWWVEGLIMGLIVTNLVILIIQSARSSFDHPRKDGFFGRWEDYVLFVIFCIFTVEVFAKIIVSGLIVNPKMEMEYTVNDAEGQDTSVMLDQSTNTNEKAPVSTPTKSAMASTTEIVSTLPLRPGPSGSGAMASASTLQYPPPVKRAVCSETLDSSGSSSPRTPNAYPRKPPSRGNTIETFTSLGDTFKASATRLIVPDRYQDSDVRPTSPNRIEAHNRPWSMTAYSAPRVVTMDEFGTATPRAQRPYASSEAVQADMTSPEASAASLINPSSLFSANSRPFRQTDVDSYLWKRREVVPFAQTLVVARAQAPYSAYLRHSWNRLDFLAVVCFWVSFFLAISHQEMAPTRHIYIFRAISVLRCARLLAVTSGTATILSSLKRAMPLLGQVFALTFFFMLMFSIIGVQAFKSNYRRQCVWDPALSNISTAGDSTLKLGQICGGFNDNGRMTGYLRSNGFTTTNVKGYHCPLGQRCVEGDNPKSGLQSFDNIVESLLQIMVVMSANGWSTTMYDMAAADFFGWSVLFFVVCLLITNFWMANLIVAVISNTFASITSQTNRSAFAAETVKPTHGGSVRTASLREENMFRRHRRKAFSIYRWCALTVVPTLSIAVILADVIIQANKSWIESRDRSIALDAHLWFAIYFVVEILVRASPFALQRDLSGFVQSTRNVVDLCLAVVTIIIEIPGIKHSAWFPWMTFFSLARFYRFILVFPFMRSLAGIVFGSSGGLLNMILFLLLMVGLSSLFVVQILRGDVAADGSDSGLESSITFKSIYNSFLGMYQIFSSENWTDPLWNVLSGTQTYKQDFVSGVILCAWFFFANFILLQMFIAVINENFTVAESDRRWQQIQDYLAKKRKGLLDPEWAQKAAMAPHPQDSFLGRFSPYMYRWKEFQLEQQAERLREMGQPVSPRPPTSMAQTLYTSTKHDLGRLWQHVKSFWFVHRDEEFKLDNLRPHSFTGASPNGGGEGQGSDTEDTSAPARRAGGHIAWPATVLEFDVNQYGTDSDEQGAKNDAVRRGIARTRTDLGLVVNEPVSQAMVDAEYQERMRNDPKREMMLFLNRYPSYDKTLWLFTNRSRIRRVCQSIVSPSYGERIFGRRTNKIAHQTYRIILICSIVASVSIAGFATPTYRKEYMQAHSGTLGKHPWFYFVDALLTILFLVEIVLKVIADGLVFTPNAYLMNGWNIMDLLVVATMLVNMSSGEDRIARVSRAFRPLRFISLSKHIRRTCEHMFGKGVKRMIQASLLAILYIIPFAIWGQNLFAGLLYSCNDTSDDILSKNQCQGEFSTSPVGAWTFLAPRVWANPTKGSKYSFDNFHSALLILFEIVSLEGWIDVMLTSMSIVGRDRQLSPGNMPVNALFFVLYNLVGAVIVLTLFVSVIIENFRSLSGTAFLTTEQRQWIDLKRLIARQRPAKRPIRRPSLPFRRWCFDRAVRKDGWFNRIFTLIYAFNAIVLMTDAYGQPYYADYTRYVLYLFVAFMFLTETMVHLIGLGGRAYVLNWWSWFDMAVITGVLVCTSILFADVGNYRARDAQKFFVCAVCFKLVQRIDSLNQLFRTAVVSLPHFISIFALWTVLFLVWGLMTMEIFGLTRWGPNETYLKNFSTLGNAIVFLIMMSTGENWNQYMHDYSVGVPLCLPNDSYLLSDCGSPGWALFLFISWNIISMYIFLNMFTGTVVENFSYVFHLGGKSLLTRRQMRQFKTVWADFDTRRTGMLKRHQIIPFLHRITGALDVKIYRGEFSVPAIVASCFINPSDVASLHSSRTGGSRRTDGSSRTGGSGRTMGALFQRKRGQAAAPSRSTEVNLAALNACLDMIDVPDVQRRRHRFIRIYQEMLLAYERSSPDEEKRGVPFRQVLLILASYKLVKEVQALEVADLVERKAQLELIERRISLERVKGILHTSYVRKRFLAQRRARQREGVLNHVPPAPAESVPLQVTVTQDLLSAREPVQLVPTPSAMAPGSDGGSIALSPSHAAPTMAWRSASPLDADLPPSVAIEPSNSAQTIHTASPETMMAVDLPSSPVETPFELNQVPTLTAPRVVRRLDTLDRFEGSQWANVLRRISLTGPVVAERGEGNGSDSGAEETSPGGDRERSSDTCPVSPVEGRDGPAGLASAVRPRPQTHRRETPSMSLAPSAAEPHGPAGDT